jgi:flagellar biosynthesis protein FliP
MPARSTIFRAVFFWMLVSGFWLFPATPARGQSAPANLNDLLNRQVGPVTAQQQQEANLRRLIADSGLPARTMTPTTSSTPGATGQNPVPLPDLSSQLPTTTDPKKLSSSLQILLLLSVLTLAPSILLMTTCFTRIVIVMSLLRQALGASQLPPNQI